MPLLWKTLAKVLVVQMTDAPGKESELPALVLDLWNCNFACATVKNKIPFERLKVTDANNLSHLNAYSASLNIPLFRFLVWWRPPLVVVILEEAKEDVK